MKVWATVVASGAIDLENYKEWLNSIKSGPKSTRASGSDVAVVRKPVLDIAKKVTSTRWAFKVKSERSFKARQTVLGWRQKNHIDCGTALFVYRLGLPIIASAKRAIVPDVQNVLF